MNKRIKAPKIVRGGIAVPLGNNFYYMRGRKHEQGGIDVGSNPKNGLEVEDGEVMQLTNKNIKVYSSVPFLNGKSPAEKVLNGENPNSVFNAQEKYKDRKGLNDDGTKKKKYGGDDNIKYIYDKINKKNTPDFIRMRNPNRKHIQDWEYKNAIATNKVSIGTDENGQDFLYNEVQDLGNGDLHDFTNPKYNHKSYDGMNSAIERGDTIHINSIKDGLIFSRNYKNVYKGFNKYKNGGIYTIQANGKTRLRMIPSTGNLTKAAYGTKLPNYDVITNFRNNINKPINPTFSIDPLYNRISKPKTIKYNVPTNPSDILYPNKKNINDLINQGTTITNNNENNKNDNTKRQFENFNVGDVISLTGNIIGGITSNVMNRKTLDKLSYDYKPVGKVASKLKTKININTQLKKLRETFNNYEKNIYKNVSSSKVALNKQLEARKALSEQINDLYTNKENKETELINTDILNRQSVINSNIDEYNKYLAGKVAFDNAIIEKKSENDINLVNTFNAGLQNTVSNIEQRNRDRQSRLAMLAAYPNVNPRILKNLGIKGITDKDIERWERINKK